MGALTRTDSGLYKTEFTPLPQSTHLYLNGVQIQSDSYIELVPGWFELDDDIEGTRQPGDRIEARYAHAGEVPQVEAPAPSTPAWITSAKYIIYSAAEMAGQEGTNYDKPGVGWKADDFDDSAWLDGPRFPFGSNAAVGQAPFTAIADWPYKPWLTLWPSVSQVGSGSMGSGAGSGAVYVRLRLEPGNYRLRGRGWNHFSFNVPNYYDTFIAGNYENSGETLNWYSFTVSVTGNKVISFRVADWWLSNQTNYPGYFDLQIEKLS